MTTQPNSDSCSSGKRRAKEVISPSTISPAATLTQAGTYEICLTVVPLAIGVVSVACLIASVMVQPMQSLLNSDVVVWTNFGIHHERFVTINAAVFELRRT